MAAAFYAIENMVNILSRILILSVYIHMPCTYVFKVGIVFKEQKNKKKEFCEWLSKALSNFFTILCLFLFSRLTETLFIYAMHRQNMRDCLFENIDIICLWEVVKKVKMCRTQMKAFQKFERVVKVAC